MTDFQFNTSRFSSARGFTLLELLIAASLSAVLMTVLVAGMNIISRDWEKHGQHLDKKLDESLLLLQIEKAIIGTFPYKFKESNLAKKELFFDGRKTKLSWISTVSPDHSGGLTLWHIEIKDEGGMYLYVLPTYPGNLNKQLEKHQNKQSKPTLYFKDYKISFFYLEKNKQNMKKWTQRWETKDKQSLPIGVRMVFKPKEELLDNSDQANTVSHYELFGFIRALGKGERSSFGGGPK